MISNLQTENFKKINEVDLDFTEGLNVLKGPNWSGKSTTLNAIKFALQGVQGIPGSKDDIPTWDSKGKCEVLLELGDYTIIRSLKDCNIYHNGEDPVATGHTACNSYLDDLFGISVANYNMLHFSDQGETAGLLTIGASELQKMVETIADVTVIDKVIKLASSDISMLKGKLEGKTLIDTKELNNSIKEGSMEKEKLELEIKEREGDLNKFTLKRKEHTDSINTLLDKVKLVKEAEETLKSDEIARAGYVATRDSLKEKIEKIPESLEPYNEKVKEADKQLKDLRTYSEEAIKSSDRFASISEWLDVSSASALEEENNWLSRKKSIEAAIETEKSKHNKLAARVESARLQIENLEEAVSGSVCQTCKRPFSEDKKHLEEQKQLLENSKLNHSTLLKEFKELGIAVQEMEKELSEVMANPTATVNVERVIADFKSEMESLSDKFLTKKELDKLPNDILVKEEALADLRLAKVTAEKEINEYAKNKPLYDAVSKLILNLDPFIRSNKLKITNTKEQEDELEKLRSLHSDLKNNIDTKSNELKILIDSTLVNLKFNISSWDRELTKAEQENKDLRKNRETQSNASALVKYLRDSRSRFLSSIWSRILGYASSFVKSCTNEEMSGITRDDKGKFNFIEDGVSRPVASASGAQKSFMGVGVRIGLAKALYGSGSFMVLDEPSSDMSIKNSTKLVSTLMGTGMQIIYSTHSDLEELSAGNVIDLGELL